MVSARMLPHAGLRHVHFEPDAEVLSVSTWLARQRAESRDKTDAIAAQLMEADDSPPITNGPTAAVVAQPRGAMWVVGQLGGPPVVHVVPDEAKAQEAALKMGADLGVEAIVIDQGGDVMVRSHGDPTPPSPTGNAPSFKVARHEEQWGIFLEGRVVATAPTRERARNKARRLKANTDFTAGPRLPDIPDE